MKVILYEHENNAKFKFIYNQRNCFNITDDNFISMTLVVNLLGGQTTGLNAY